MSVPTILAGSMRHRRSVGGANASLLPTFIDASRAVGVSTHDRLGTCGKHQSLRMRVDPLTASFHRLRPKATSPSPGPGLDLGQQGRIVQIEAGIFPPSRKQAKEAKVAPAIPLECLGI